MRGQGLFLSKNKGTERTREGRKWVFCPVQTPAFHTNPGITNQHANAYFLPCSILFPRECASPSPLPWRPLAHNQGSCILCCSGTARMRAFCCKPRRSHQRRTGRQPTGGKPAMAGSQHALSSRQEPHGRTCGTCFYVCIHTQQWAILWTVFLHLPSLAETRHTNNQHLHHYRRRASTALLEAHAGHATPTKRARGQADRWWAGWDHEALRRGAPGKPNAQSEKEAYDTCLGQRGVCVFSGSCHATRRWKQGQTDAHCKQPLAATGEFPLHLRLPCRMRHNATRKNTYVCGTTSESLHSTHHHSHPTRHTKTCLTHPHPPISPFFPRAPTNSSSSTSEEVSRECSPVGKRRVEGEGVQLRR